MYHSVLRHLIFCCLAKFQWNYASVAPYVFRGLAVRALHTLIGCDYNFTL